MVERETIAGHLVYIYNEKGERVLDGGCMLENRWFPTMDSSGKILIPYRRKGGNATRKLLLKSSDGRQEITEFLHKEE